MREESFESGSVFSPNIEEQLTRLYIQCQLLSDSTRLGIFLCIAENNKHLRDIALERNIGTDTVMQNVRELLIMGLAKEDAGYYQLTDEGVSLVKNASLLASRIYSAERTGDDIERHAGNGDASR